MTLRLIASILIFSSAFEASAFVNIELIRRDAKEGFLGRTGARLNGQSGNVDKVSGTFSSLNILRGERDDALFIANYGYSETESVKDTNNGAAHVRYVFLSREKFAYEVFLQEEFDQFKDLSSRTLLGANVRQTLSQEPEHSLYLGYGSFYEMDFYENGEKRNEGRGNLYLSFINRLNQQVSASVIGYYQPAFSGIKDFRIRFDSGLNFAISSRLALEVALSVVHDNELPVDVEKTDLTYGTGLTLSY
jgi:putative salt-induced outer membrane protein YdiY